MATCSGQRQTFGVEQGELSDGVVLLRPSSPDDASAIIAGRDAVFRRFIGDGSAVPTPRYCIEVAGVLVGWIDHDHDEDRWWLAADEVNIGYHVFPQHRGQGHASRAVALVLDVLRSEAEVTTATLLIHPENAASIAIAVRHGFERADDVTGRTFWRRPVDRPH